MPSTVYYSKPKRGAHGDKERDAKKQKADDLEAGRDESSIFDAPRTPIATKAVPELQTPGFRGEISTPKPQGKALSSATSASLQLRSQTSSSQTSQLDKLKKCDDVTLCSDGVVVAINDLSTTTVLVKRPACKLYASRKLPVGYMVAYYYPTEKPTFKENGYNWQRGVTTPADTGCFSSNHGTFYADEQWQTNAWYRADHMNVPNCKLEHMTDEEGKAIIALVTCIVVLSGSELGHSYSDPHPSWETRHSCTTN